MQESADRSFHIVMGVFLGLSLAIDQQEFAAWRAGKVSMVSLVVAMVWLGRFAWEGFRRRDAAIETLRNRVRDAEEKLDELIRDARQRRGPF